ncbi:hypothetical protein D3C77_558980 [compost metagenome]
MGLPLDTKAVIDVQQHGAAIRIEHFAVQRAHPMKLVGGIKLSPRLVQALIDDILNRLQFGLSTKSTNTLDLIGLDGEALRQVDGVEWQQDAFAAADHQPGSAAFACGYQGELVAVLLDLHGQGRDTLFFEQTETGQTAWYQLLLVDRSSQCSNTERIVFKNGDFSHGAYSRK